MISFAYAQDAAGQAGGLMGFLPLIAIFVIFYFLMISPQQKRAKEHKELLTNLKKGDEVLTAGGVVGRISDIGEFYVNLDIANNVTVKFQKQQVISLLPKGSSNDL